VWANSPWSDSYESVWATELSIRVGNSGVSHDLREWINEGLMTFYFLVVGLEAKRELDLGQLRERRRIWISWPPRWDGMSVPIAIFLVFRRGRRTARRAGALRCRTGHRVRARAQLGLSSRARRACACGWLTLAGDRRLRGAADRDRHRVHRADQLVPARGGRPASSCTALRRLRLGAGPEWRLRVAAIGRGRGVWVALAEVRHRRR
jgi:hypothetical protein